jgi:hypothetical protein
MPLARYFLFVGAVLLAVLFVADAFLPKLPMAESVEAHHPAIRLYSDERWPERIVLDPSVLTIMKETDTISAPAVAGEESEKTTEAPADANRSINTRDAFAELQQSKMPTPPSANRDKVGQENQRKMVRRQAPQKRMRLVWRQPSYGWYDRWDSW